MSLETYKEYFPLMSDLVNLTETKFNNEEFQSLIIDAISVLELSEKEVAIIHNIESFYIKSVSVFQKYLSLSNAYLEKKKIVETIQNKNHVEQRSDQWYEDMKIYLTASEFSKLYGSLRERGKLVQSKTILSKKYSSKPIKTDFLKAMDWGVRFEPVVKQFVEELWRCSIYECGRIRHDSLQFKLAASPDGIIINTDIERFGRLIEIKCPFSRKIGEGIPFEYWVQMQIQMEVTGIEECEYIEVEIQSKHYKQLEPILKDTYLKQSTMYLLEKEDIYTYLYTEVEKNKLLEEGYNIVETIPYNILSYYNVIVSRDRGWYTSSVELQEKFWEDVEKAKKGEFELPPLKRKKQEPCLFVEEE